MFGPRVSLDADFENEIYSPDVARVCGMKKYFSFRACALRRNAPKYIRSGENSRRTIGKKKETTERE